VRVTIPVGTANQPTNPVAALRDLFTTLQTVEPYTAFHPSLGKSGDPIHLVDQFPTTEKSFKDYFTIYENVKRLGTRIHHEVCFRLTTKRQLWEIKNADNAAVLAQLKEKHVTIHEDLFAAKRQMAIGGLFGLNPIAINRQLLHAEITSSLNLVAQAMSMGQPTAAETADTEMDPLVPIDVDDDEDADDDSSQTTTAIVTPNFTLSIRTFVFTRKKRKTTAQALAIDCAEEDTQTLHNLLEAVDEQGLMPLHSYYVPSGMTTAMDDDEYHNLLATQHNLTTNSVVIPVQGLSQSALESYITNASGQTTKLRYEILRQPSIERIEPTKHNGKWFLISNLHNSKEASRFIDHDLPIYFSQISNNPLMKVPGWDSPIRSKRHGEITSSPKLIEKLRSRFATAPTIVESVRPRRKATATTIRYAADGPSFAAVAAAGAAAGEEPPAAGTPEGKKRRKEIPFTVHEPRRKEVTVISEAGIISSPAADITAELRNTIKQLTELMTTIRQEVEGKITALTIQVQQLSQSLANSTHQRTEQSTERDTQQHMEPITLEHTVHSAVTAAVGKITSDIADINSLLQDRDARISDEIQGLRDELSEVSQQPRTHISESTTYHTPQTTPRKQHQYGKRDYSPNHKRK
jgi:hypothetical protein